MRVLIAPDKFKGSLSAQQVCDAVEQGIKKFDATIETIKHPLADGGEGTLEILQNYFNLKPVTVEVQNSLFEPVQATYSISGNSAFIEMSNASGLQLLKKEAQNCYYTSTIGTGQLILDAIEKGAKNITLFIGGSATNDAGIGMASALGYRFYNSKNELINPIGKELINISKIDTKNVEIDFKKINFTVVCDVENPLYGKQGAAYIYGKQKGASKNQIKSLDLGLMNFSTQVQKYLKKDIATIKGAGAAGGLGAGALCFLNAKIQSGIDFVINQTKFKKHLKNKVDLIITGEGSVDKQTLEGKVVNGVGKIANKYKIPFYIVAGVVKDKKLIEETLKPEGINSIMGLNVSLEDAITNASLHLNTIAFDIVRDL
jgi:glycerate kinase